MQVWRALLAGGGVVGGTNAVLVLQYVVSVLVAAAAFHASMGPPGSRGLEALAPYLAALGAYLGFNLVALGVMGSVGRRSHKVAAWRAAVLRDYHAYFVVQALGILTTVLYLHHGPVGLGVGVFFLSMLGWIFNRYYAMAESARRTARHLTAVLDAAESGILVVDGQNRVALLNRVAAGLLGTTEDYLLGRSLPEVTELLAGRSRNPRLVPDRLPRVPAGGGAEHPTRTGELEILTDPPTVVRVSDAPVLDGGERVGRIFVFTDITREKGALARLEEFYDEAIRALVAAVEARDPYTRGHSVRVSRYAVMIGEGLGLTPEQLRILRYAGLLHDIGKLAVEDRILRKAGPLTPEEREAIKQHPVVGAAILGSAGSFAALVPAVRHHHERFDGTGYPDGLAGDAIPVEARILAVADAFDAMTSDRPYRPALARDVACERLIRGRGTQFDPEVVDTFLECVRDLRAKEDRAVPRVTSLAGARYW